MNYQGLGISTLLLAYPGSETPTSIPGARISYNLTVGWAVGTCGNYNGGSGSGGTSSGSKVSVRVFAFAGLFSSLAIAMTISRTMSNS